MTTPGPPLTLVEVGEFADRVAVWLQELEPVTLDAEHARQWCSAFALVDRLAQAGVAVAAKRLDDTQACRGDVAQSAASFVAQETGGTLGQAKASIETRIF